MKNIKSSEGKKNFKISKLQQNETYQVIGLDEDICPKITKNLFENNTDCLGQVVKRTLRSIDKENISCELNILNNSRKRRNNESLNSETPAKKSNKCSTKFSCGICEKQFKIKVRYEAHLKTHDQPNKFPCNHCEEDFDNKVLLKIHNGLMHSNVELQQCPVCNKMVKFLRPHLQTHNDPTFHCDLCEKSFTKKVYYEIHQRIHKGIKPYECHICHKRFQKKSNCNVHLKAHERKRDDAGNYLEIKRRTPAEMNVKNYSTGEMCCGPDLEIERHYILLNSKSCDTDDLEQYCRGENNFDNN